MSRRLELHTILCGLLGCPERGDQCRAYFQPPASVQMKYDCIRYKRARITSDHADNLSYLLHDRYELTVIYKNPDSELPRLVAALPMCEQVREYTADNLHHEIFNLYF